MLDDDAPAAAQLERVARACDECAVAPKHVVALPSAYLLSYQPDGRWPTGLAPRDACAGLRSTFPAARIGAGVLTNFAEFNRCRPRDIASDYVTHGSSAIVHSADDASVMQTLETAPHTFRSARAIAGHRAYRLGLTAIGMRMNPYGATVSPNPDQRRLTMATWDPRARALFGSAWAVGALAATLGHQVEAMALAAPVGPFGVLARSGAGRSSLVRRPSRSHDLSDLPRLEGCGCGGETARCRGIAQGTGGARGGSKRRNPYGHRQFERRDSLLGSQRRRTLGKARRFHLRRRRRRSKLARSRPMRTQVAADLAQIFGRCFFRAEFVTLPT